jgi:hypothetical protein
MTQRKDRDPPHVCSRRNAYFIPQSNACEFEFSCTDTLISSGSMRLGRSRGSEAESRE